MFFFYRHPWLQGSLRENHKEANAQVINVRLQIILPKIMFPNEHVQKCFSWNVALCRKRIKINKHTFLFALLGLLASCKRKNNFISAKELCELHVKRQAYLSKNKLTNPFTCFPPFVLGLPCSDICLRIDWSKVKYEYGVVMLKNTN